MASDISLVIFISLRKQNGEVPVELIISMDKYPNIFYLRLGVTVSSPKAPFLVAPTRGLAYQVIPGHARLLFSRLSEGGAFVLIHAIRQAEINYTCEMRSVNQGARMLL